MTKYEVIYLAISIIALILVPTEVLLVRIIVKWIRLEDRLGNIANSLADIAKDKDKVHAELVAQIRETSKSLADQLREDRRATNDRLRYLELGGRDRAV
jgi:hypothetical protein